MVWIICPSGMIWRYGGRLLGMVPCESSRALSETPFLIRPPSEGHRHELCSASSREYRVKQRTQAVRLYFPSSGKNPAFILMDPLFTLSSTFLTVSFLTGRILNSRPIFSDRGLCASEFERNGIPARSGMAAPYELSAERPSSRKSIGSLP